MDYGLIVLGTLRGIWVIAFNMQRESCHAKPYLKTFVSDILGHFTLARLRARLRKKILS